MQSNSSYRRIPSKTSDHPVTNGNYFSWGKLLRGELNGHYTDFRAEGHDTRNIPTVYSADGALVLHDREFDIVQVATPEGKKFSAVATYVPQRGIFYEKVSSQNAELASSAITRLLGLDTVDEKVKAAIRPMLPSLWASMHNGGKA